MLFPHDTVRKIQDKLMESVQEAITNKKTLVVHAPTGLGKTASAIAPALEKALNENLTVFFLTSKHTQHKIAVDTLKKIQEKYNKKFFATSLLGKKWYCLQPGTQKLPSKDFAEYCRAMVEDENCSFHKNVHGKNALSMDARTTIDALKNKVRDSDEVIKESSKCNLCPYEISVQLSKQAKLIVTDYYYLFNKSIRTNFLKRIEKALEDCIVIVDEAHNLPSRVKDLASEYLTLIVLERAIKEAKKHSTPEIVNSLESLANILGEYGRTFKDKKLGDYGNKKTNSISFDEKYIDRQAFIERISQVKDYEELQEELTIVGDNVREAQTFSFIGSVARFLEAWKQPDEGFARILSVKENNVILSYRCLDPSLVTSDVINNSHSSILMSGTLTPTTMYTELLGAQDPIEKTFGSPFPEENRMNIIIPKTSTKFSARSEEQYKAIAGEIDKVVNNVPGNVMVFFPSYYIKDHVKTYLANHKTLLDEYQGLTKEERNEVLDKFRSYKKTGAVLLAVTSGSFGEGIDLPGDEVKGVVVVGLPLQRPDLEAKSLIEYYDIKFGKGWDYGYVYPAFTKTIQSAGRCIRSDTDKGVIVFLDERYAWPNYKRCFPESWDMKITLMYPKWIEKFFGEEKKE